MDVRELKEATNKKYLNIEKSHNEWVTKKK